MNGTSKNSSPRKSSTVTRAARHLRRNVVAYLALFLALSGSAYAVERGSVGTKQLKKNAVKTAKIANGAVNGRKLAAGSVDTTKLTDGAVQGGKLADGAVTNTKLAAGSVTRDKLAPGAVGPDQVGLIRQTVQIDDTKADSSGTFTDVLRHGPFTVRTRCIHATQNSPAYGNVYVKSSELAASTALQNSPGWRLEANSDFRPVSPTMNLGQTGVSAINVWAASGRYLQLSVTGTALPTVAKNDCAFLLTGFAG